MITLGQFRRSFSKVYPNLYFRVEENKYNDKTLLSELSNKENPISEWIDFATAAEIKSVIEGWLNLRVDFYFEKAPGSRPRYIKIEDIELSFRIAELNEMVIDKGAVSLEYWFDESNKNVSNENSDTLTKDQIEFLETKSWYNRDEVQADWLDSRAFILEAVKKDGRWIEQASETFKSDIEIVSTALSKSGSALEYVSAEMKKNKQVVLLALEKDGLALEYADSSIKSDKEVVLIALEQDGLALEYADSSMKSDKEVVKKAISKDINAISFADNQLLEDFKFIEELIQFIELENYKEFFFNLPSKFRFDKSVIDLISKQYPNATRWYDAESYIQFLDYIAYFDSQDPYENEDNLTDFVNEYSVNLSNSHFESLKDEFEILVFNIDNSNYAIEELYGSERFTIIYDLKENRILPNNKQSPNEDELGLIKKSQYLDSIHVGMWDYFHDKQGFDAGFGVSNFNKEKENSFYVAFEGGSVYDKKCDPDTLTKIKNAFTPSDMYHFISDVIRMF